MGAVAAVAAVGAVHAKLCSYNLAGALAGQEGKPDLPSAAFHLLVAAA